MVALIIATPVVAMVPPVIVIVMIVMPTLIVLRALIATLRGWGRDGSQPDYHQAAGK
ncbi:MAG: hypothetical protein ACREPQ_08865 [Rhodanobacter sp.]